MPGRLSGQAFFLVEIKSPILVGMVQAGYPEIMAAGVITNAGTLGILIPLVFLALIIYIPQISLLLPEYLDYLKGYR